MGITRQLTWKLIGLLGLLLLNSPLQLAAISGYGLTASPEKCFQLEETEECQVSVKFQWISESKSSYCLFLTGQASPLNCWKESSHGTFEYLLVSNTDSQFELRSSQNNQPSYQAEVRIFKQVKQLKKRRRNPWSFY